MMQLPLTIEKERGGKSALAQILEAMDSPFIFYLVFVLPFMLIALLFRQPRRYTWTFEKKGITVRLGKIVTQRIRPDRILGIDTVGGALRIRWKKTRNGPALEAAFPATGVAVTGMSPADAARELAAHYRCPG